MPRLIDADALLEYLEQTHEWLFKLHATLTCEDAKRQCSAEIAVINDIERRVKNAPTIDTEPVQHGRWEYRGFDARCTVCGYWNNADRVTRIRNDPPYCPWCHAKMDGKDNNVPTKPEQHHCPEDCVYYATRQRDGRAVCLGTREVDPCEGAGCKRWKPKKDGGATNG